MVSFKLFQSFLGENTCKFSYCSTIAPTFPKQKIVRMVGQQKGVTLTWESCDNTFLYVLVITLHVL